MLLPDLKKLNKARYTFYKVKTANGHIDRANVLNG